MQGYIEYTADSPLYPDGDTYESVLVHVRNNYDMYKKYASYQFQGPSSDELNQAVETLFHPRREGDTIGRYIYFLPPDIRVPPIEYSIPIIRNIYSLRHIRGNMYRQEGRIDITPETERYQVSGIPVGEDTPDAIVPVYTGDQGSFLLLQEDIDVTPILERMSILHN